VGKARLKKEDWYVADVSMQIGRKYVERWHYSKGGSNTRVYMHGLYCVGERLPRGVAWWIPPTKGAALATYPENWKGVLALTRLVIVPGEPQNAASFLLAGSRKLIDRKKWPCLVTYADEWRGHTGGIYRADNWEYAGKTKPQPVWVRDGVMVARKAGPKTRTKTEMLQLGAEYLGSHAKHKFTHIVKT
jgi:hypothetical protein